MHGNAQMTNAKVRRPVLTGHLRPYRALYVTHDGLYSS
jgi:hypothetical protein